MSRHGHNRSAMSPLSRGRHPSCLMLVSRASATCQPLERSLVRTSHPKIQDLSPRVATIDWCLRSAHARDFSLRCGSEAFEPRQRQRALMKRGSFRKFGSAMPGPCGFAVNPPHDACCCERWGWVAEDPVGVVRHWRSPSSGRAGLISTERSPPRDLLRDRELQPALHLRNLRLPGRRRRRDADGGRPRRRDEDLPRNPLLRADGARTGFSSISLP